MARIGFEAGEKLLADIQLSLQESQALMRRPGVIADDAAREQLEVNFSAVLAGLTRLAIGDWAISPKEFFFRFNIASATFHKYLAAGLITYPPYITAGRSKLILVASAKIWVRQQTYPIFRTRRPHHRKRRMATRLYQMDELELFGRGNRSA
ncbi:MAG TPA: hypothetical protein VMQ11_18165 [Alphaproteobacteria bacterium]|nr:hypothetical protein [Alphaproteobacteria bacterium]HTY70324.1 hypothetical protein [Alphaproteobacteria bacterium]